MCELAPLPIYKLIIIIHPFMPCFFISSLCGQFVMWYSWRIQIHPRGKKIKSDVRFQSLFSARSEKLFLEKLNPTLKKCHLCSLQVVYTESACFIYSLYSSSDSLAGGSGHPKVSRYVWGVTQWHITEETFLYFFLRHSSSILFIYSFFLFWCVCVCVCVNYTLTSPGLKIYCVQK